MKSKIAQKILNRTPKDVKVFVRMYGDIVVRIHTLIKQKGLTQKELAKKMGKKPSEINKWLNNEHNLTLKTLAKLEVVLEEPIIHVPVQKSVAHVKGASVHLTVYSNHISNNAEFSFVPGKVDISEDQIQDVA